MFSFFHIILLLISPIPNNNEGVVVQGVSSSLVFDASDIVYRLAHMGVEVDYSYNETASPLNEAISAPGCPKSIDGLPWVLSPRRRNGKGNPRCYLTGHPGGCSGVNQVMHFVPRSRPFGVCSCVFDDCLQQGGGEEIVTSHPRYSFCTPTGTQCVRHVYDRRRQLCFNMYSQGPCRRDYWLEEDGLGGVVCSRRSCAPGEGLLGPRFSNGTRRCCEGVSIMMMAGGIARGNCPPGKVYSPSLQTCVWKLGKMTIG